MKKIIFIVCITIILLSGCTSQKKSSQMMESSAENLESTISPEKPVNIYTDLSTLPQEIEDIIYNDEIFFDVESQKMYTKKSYKIRDNNDVMQPAGFGSYLVCDFDEDGEQELAVEMSIHSSDWNKIVFDKQEDMVYAYPFVYRGFLHVYEDGGIYSASAADQFMIYKVKFNKSEQEETILMDETVEETESGKIVRAWYAQGEKVSEEDFRNFSDEYFEKNKDIPWSESSIDSQLLQVELSKIPIQKKNKIVYQVDLTGDGKEDILTVDISKIKRFWRRKAVISLEDSTGEELWQDEMELSDTSGKLYYLCKIDGRYCLLRYIMNYTNGDGKYSFEVFHPKKTGEEILDTEEIKFKTYAEKKYVRNFFAENMYSFRYDINEYLANGILLLSIDEGEVKYSTENAAVTYWENYKKIIPIDIQNENPYTNNQLAIMEDRIIEEMRQK